MSCFAKTMHAVFIEHPSHSLVFFIWSSLLRLADKPLSIELSIGTFGNSLEVLSNWSRLWHDTSFWEKFGNQFFWSITLPVKLSESTFKECILSPKSFYNIFAVSYLKQLRDLNQMIFNVTSLVWTMIMVRNDSNFP